LKPDEATPKSSDFSSDDLALNACWQKVANCGQRNHTLKDTSGTVVLRAKGMTKDETCSWIVKTECGYPVITVTK